VNILEKEQERGDYKRGERKCSLDEKSPGRRLTVSIWDRGRFKPTLLERMRMLRLKF
jgi:hypothetical protein